MGVKLERLDKVSIVILDGIVDETIARKMRSLLDEISSTDTVYVIFELSQVQFLSSTGMGLLVAFTNEHQKKYGTGSVILVGLTEHIKRTMSILGLLDLFVLVSKKEEALKLCSSKNDKNTKTN